MLVANAADGAIYYYRGRHGGADGELPGLSAGARAPSWSSIAA